MNDRVILIDKPAGMTSFGVVARIRRVLSQRAGRKVKVGHCGTLDPFATGLLVLVTGKECKNAMRYTKLDKVYEATIILGKVSTTGDPEGEIAPHLPVGELNKPQASLEGGADREYSRSRAARPDASTSLIPTLSAVRSTLEKFVGNITQRPPIFSAIKIDGQRAYKLARDGKEVEIPERTVTIHSLELLNYDYPQLTIRTHVSSGTYIRSLASDIGEALGTGAYCHSLRRTQIADWSVAEAQRLQDFGVDS